MGFVLQFAPWTFWAGAIWALAAPSLLFPVDFNAPKAYAFGTDVVNGYSLAAGDFNGDKTPDLAVLVTAESRRESAGVIEIFLSRGDGSFVHGESYRLPSAPIGVSTAVVAGDFNHDGKLDLAAVTSVVSILLGNGDGTFQPAVNYSAGGQPYSVAMGDFNGDGNPDLAITNGISDNVSILLGNADGTFQTAVNYPVGIQPEYLAVGDFNGDGRPDLAVTNYNYTGPGTVSILFGVGDGTFHATVNHATGKQPLSIAVGDFNGDGKPDLAITLAGGLSIMLAAGGGDFQPPFSVEAGPGPAGVVAVDVDRDGKTDLAVVNVFSGGSQPGGSTVSILKGNGNGSFQPPTPYYVAEYAQAIAFRDFKGKGELDLAVVCGAALSILLNNNRGGFQQPITQDAGTYPTSIVAADFNGDGKPDLAVSNAQSSNISILLGKGDGTFLPQTTVDVGSHPVSLVAADFNGDGKLDLALCSYSVESYPTLAVLLGNGDGTFQPSLNTTEGCTFLVVADFNRDGKPDLLNVDLDVEILLGNGDGTFQVSYSYGSDVLLTVGAVGDFNGDGKPDAVVQGEECDEYCFDDLYVLLGNGDGTFSLVFDQPYVGPYFLAVGNLNGDGKQDLMGADGANVEVALGNGDGTFTYIASYPAGRATWLSKGDFNGDGKLDVAANGPGTVAILLGNGDGSFQPQQQFIVGGCTAALTVADFNGDGKPDVATANGCSNNVTILTNVTP
jgi:hypothetical protein